MHIHKWVRRFVVLKWDDGRLYARGTVLRINYKVCEVCRRILL